jgi:hypothetical protein
MPGRAYQRLPPDTTQKEEPHVNTQRLTSLGSVALMVAAIGCGGSDGKGGTTGQTTKYSFAVAPTALNLPPGGTQDVVVSIDRGSTTPFTGSITFALEVPNTIATNGVTAGINPNPATANMTTLSVAIASSVLPGSYTLAVVGTSGADSYTVNLPLTVTGAASTLLVDADYSPNNQDPTDVTATPSASDTLFASLLQHESVAFNTFVVPYPATGLASTPASTDLTGYSTIVWYTGEAYGDPIMTVTPAQQAILEAWLDQGNHTLLIFSQNMVYDLRVGDWNSTPETNTFLTNYVGAIGSSDDGDAVHNATYNVMGATGTAFAGEIFQVIMDSPLNSTGDVINPATGTDTLATVVENPDNVLAAPAPVAIIVGRKSVGAAHSSTVVYAGMPIENVLMTVGNDTAQQLFHAALVYTGLKSP